MHIRKHLQSSKKKKKKQKKKKDYRDKARGKVKRKLIFLIGSEINKNSLSVVVAFLT